MAYCMPFDKVVRAYRGKADAIGGTWLVNRYPGARCDIESIEYSCSFSDEIQQEWVWTETMPAQPEIEAYLNFVATRLDLRRDIRPASDSFAPFVVAASGILSVPLEPAIDGRETFAGTSLHTSRWPREEFDFAGKRVGVIGTGSTGVQLIPVVAKEAGHLSVFQRSPAYTLPWDVRRFEAGELDALKAQYAEIRAAQREHPVGAARLSAFSVLIDMLSRPPIKDASTEEKRRAVEEKGVMGALGWGDVFFDIEANRMATELYGAAVARIVRDPRTAAALVPTGIRTERGLHGLVVQGPGAPAAATNFVAALEQHVQWIADCLTYLRSGGHRTIEAKPSAQREWAELTTALVAPTVLMHPSRSSRYNSGNIPGKKRMYLGFTTGIPEYRRRCDEIAAGGYTGFALG